MGGNVPATTTLQHYCFGPHGSDVDAQPAELRASERSPQRDEGLGCLRTARRVGEHQPPIPHMRVVQWILIEPHLPRHAGRRCCLPRRLRRGRPNGTTRPSPVRSPASRRRMPSSLCSGSSGSGRWTRAHPCLTGRSSGGRSRATACSGCSEARWPRSAATCRTRRSCTPSSRTLSSS